LPCSSWLFTVMRPSSPLPIRCPTQPGAMEP
jgi:hypothetical protein